jgi:thiamine kinase-like enzyme
LAIEDRRLAWIHAYPSGNVAQVRARPEGLEESLVSDALRLGWGFDVEVAEYAPVGGGSYHWNVTDTNGRRAFATVDDLDRKAWLGDTRESVFDGLRRAFEASLALREGGLHFVVAPTPARNGESLGRLDSRYTVALFPFVQGEAGQFGHYRDDDQRAIALMIAQLHNATARAGSTVRTIGLDLPGREYLDAALAELNETWTGGPLSEPARKAVKESASELEELLTLADRLAAEAQKRGGGWVVTHGEPHAGNVMRTDDDRFLLDWDTVAVAPPERDLWMLVDDENGAADVYARATGAQINDAALDFFRVTWDLKDLAEYLNALRSPHQENEDTVRWLQALTNCAAIRDRWMTLLD